VVSATPSPSADPADRATDAGTGSRPAARRPAGLRANLRRRRRWVPAPIRRLWPKTLQGRLTLGFAGVVAITLLLMTAVVLNRLDEQFKQQQVADIQARTELVARFVDRVASLTVGTNAVVQADNTINPAFAKAMQSDAFRRFIADQLAEADVDIVVGRLPTDSGDSGSMVPAKGGTFHVDVEMPGQSGLTQEHIQADPVTWSATSSRYPYVIGVQLSNPWTARQTALGNLASVTAAVGLVALGIAVIVAGVMALRVTTPLRRVTEASRALAEGHLGERIPRSVIASSSSEIAALATQFNAMADQVEGSLERIRRDRDRSRDFLADVSHELRTPIAALLTFNELLTEGVVDDPGARAEFLENSRVQLERLDWLAQNLLELSKLDSGLALLDLRPDDLRVAVESAVEQARPAARRRDLDLELSLPDAPLRIRHDPQRIGQVVTNLVGNAIKFTDPGGRVTVRLAARPSSVEGEADGATIRVEDSGVGIQAEELPRVFDRFYRGSLANEARGTGSGLGLAIVRSIVDMHHGSVEVSSQVGTGTAFTIALPADPRQDAVPEPPAEAAAVGGEAAEPAPDAPPADLGKVVDSSPGGRPRLNGQASR
jgi:signal transduction histidine kinase